MRLSKLFVPIMRDAPKDAEIISHQLMLRAGMVNQSSAGIYSWLPLGLRVLRKIEQIVREEQDRAGANEVLMPTIQPADLWRQSGRYDDYGDEMLRVVDRNKRDMLYGPTNEEQITQIFRDGVKSYKQLPANLYHIQWKFRDERRPRFGVMRGREFLMKDAYSFDLTPEDGAKAYNRMFVAYLRTYARLGLKAIPMEADTGPIGGNQSHEFIILAETGESQVFCDKSLVELPPPPEDVDFDGDLSGLISPYTTPYAATDEKHDPEEFDRRVEADRQLSARGIEVGHIFFFGTKYSEPMGCKVQDAQGKMVDVQMGSYGIGVSRLVGAIIEASHDENGIVWPMSVAPYQVAVINLKVGDAVCDTACEGLIAALEAEGVEVLYDDTDERAGGKFKTMDLIGIPVQCIIGPKGLADGDVEIKDRATGARHNVALDIAGTQLIGMVRAG